MPFQQLTHGGAFGYSAVGENGLVSAKIEIPTSYTQTTTIRRGQCVSINTSGQAVVAPASADGVLQTIGVAAEDVGPDANAAALVPVVVFGALSLSTTTYTDGTWTAGNVIVPSANTAGYLQTHTCGSASVSVTGTASRVLGVVITSTSTNSLIWLNGR